uniref:Serpentine receptor class gamma n=1 Tax=Strongyloides stercoralis TaxID=6248 RepID=A0A0K0E2I3_STRER
MDNIINKTNIVEVHFTAFDAFLISFDVISFIIYFMISIIFSIKLLKKSKARSEPSTFELHFIVNFIFDVIQTSIIIFYQKFLHWGLFTDFYMEHKWVEKWYAPMLYSSIASAILGNMVCVINRYVALCHCTFYMKKWTLNWSYLLIITQTILPFIMFSFNFWFKAEKVYAASLKVYIFMVTDPTVSMINNGLISFLSGVASIITISMNLIIISKYDKLMNNITKNEKSKRISMLFYAIFITLTLAALSIQQSVRLFFVFYKYQIGLYLVTYYLFIIVPLIGCVQPYILLILSKSVRKDFGRFYFGWIYKNEVCTNKTKGTTFISKKNKVTDCII